MSVGSSGSDYDLLAAPVTPVPPPEEEKATDAAAAAATDEDKQKRQKKEMPRLFFAGEWRRNKICEDFKKINF